MSISYKGYDVHTHEKNIHGVDLKEVHITKEGKKIAFFDIPSHLPRTELSEIIQSYVDTLEKGKEA